MATQEEQAAAEKAAAEAKAEAAKKAADDASKAKEAEAAEAKETVSKADYNKLLSDISNFKRIEEERKEKEKKKQEELLKEQGKWRDLYDTAQRENEAMKVRLEKLDLAMKGMLEEEMKGLPEEFDKSLIPALDAHDQVLWLRKAKAIIMPKAEARRGDGTPPARGGEGLAGMRSIYNHPTSPKH